MRLVTYEDARGRSVGVRVGEEIRPSGFGSMTDLIRAGPAGLASAAAAAAHGAPVTDARLLAPLPTPGKIICCAVNYPQHQDENRAAGIATRPFFFAKLPSAVIGPGAPIVLPSPASKVDYEVELAVVIGRTSRRLQRSCTLEHVFGYTVLNDVSARDIQFDGDQLTIAKGADTFCPLGPEIVGPEEIPDPNDLRLATYVNEELRQSASTADQLRTVEELLEEVTMYVTLYPGDVVSTGTPGGVGFHRDPPRYLVAGDIVRAQIETIGTLVNPVITGW